MIIRRNPAFSAEQSNTRLSTLRARLERAESVAITGSTVGRPSDAPGDWNVLHGLAAGLQDQGVWLRNADRARDVLDGSDGALHAATDLLSRARERAVQLSSETYGAAERTAGASEVRALREELLGLANTRVGDRYLFAGDAFDRPAFDAAGAYQGSAATASTLVGEGRDVATTLDGSAVFQGAVDVFQTLSDLEAALLANDATAVAAALDPLEAAQQQVISARQEVGERQVAVDDATAVAENLAALLEERLTAHTSEDPTTSFTRLAQLQTTYQSALQVTAAGSGTKLFDFLR